MESRQHLPHLYAPMSTASSMAPRSNVMHEAAAMQTNDVPCGRYTVCNATCIHANHCSLEHSSTARNMYAFRHNNPPFHSSRNVNAFADSPSNSNSRSNSNNVYNVPPAPSTPTYNHYIHNGNLQSLPSNVSHHQTHQSQAAAIASGTVTNAHTRAPNENQRRGHPAHAQHDLHNAQIAQRSPQQDEQERVQITKTIATLSSLLMEHSSVNNRQIVSKLLDYRIADILYEGMLAYAHHTELQQEIQKALTMLQECIDQSSHTATTNQSGSLSNYVNSPNLASDQLPVDSDSNVRPSNSNSAVQSQGKQRRNKNNRFIKYITDSNLYECTECGKQYKHECNLRSHCKIHTEHAFCCEFCGKKFGRRSNWIEHTRIHTGERPFKCTVCQTGFKQKHGLKEHMKTHCNK